MIVIDALSKWYIDQYRGEIGFFSDLEKLGYSASNLYSTGPFTEAAVRGFWAADDPLRGKSYLNESDFRNQTIYQVFKNLNYYIYFGELIPFFNDNIYSDNKITRENPCVRGFEHIWRGRLIFYINLFKQKCFKNSDFWKLEFLLEKYFDDFHKISNVNSEYHKYMKNKKEYILDILLNEEESSFFKNQDYTMFYSCKYRNIENYKNQKSHSVTKEEIEFVYHVKEKNTDFLFEMNKKFGCEDIIENELNGSRSRCIHSNENILSHMRDENEKLPKLKEELDEFLDWYDKEGQELKIPFFAYIHNYDFHFPENFINTRYEDNPIKYNKEVKEKLQELNSLRCKKMSVSKQLSLLNIEKCLKYFYDKIRLREIDKNTIIIITSDHGISNFMYPIDKKNERWNYTKINFQIPFYMFGCGIKKYNDMYLHSSKEIVSMLLRISQTQDDIIESPLEDIDKECIITSWINGVPDYDYQKIKLGIRTQKYSITYESYLSQFFSYDNIVGLYDLLIDPDECYNLYYKDIEDDDFTILMRKLPDFWFDEILNIINADEGEYRLKKIYKFLLCKPERFREINKNAIYLTQDKLDNIISGKSIILFGDKKNVVDFLVSYNYSYKIEELWVDDLKEECFMGHKIAKEWKIKKDIPIIIVGNKEIEMLNILLDKGCFTFLIWKKRYCILKGGI